MGIKATIDDNVYEGIDTIETGGKVVSLEETYSGTKSITANGTVDVSGYANATITYNYTGE